MPTNWKPEPKGPPEPQLHPTGRGRYGGLYRWLDEHPGKWAKVTDVHGATGTNFKNRGYDVETRYCYENKNKCDVYVRKPPG
jgi:hypothetical protein